MLGEVHRIKIASITKDGSRINNWWPGVTSGQTSTASFPQSERPKQDFVANKYLIATSAL